MPGRVRRIQSWLRAASILCLLMLCAFPAFAGCPEGDSNPITSGRAANGPPVVFSLPALSGASFFLIGEPYDLTLGDSGSLPPDTWLVNLGDLEGSGRLYFQIQAPGDGPGGWGDPRTVGCPSSAEPRHPPLGIALFERQGDLDAGGAVIAASVAWNGTAYDFSAINTPTRLVQLQDGREFRVVDATPFVILSGIRQDGGETLEVSAVAGDPDGDPLHGALDFFGPSASTVSLPNVALEAFDCGDGLSPDGRPGQGMVYFKDYYYGASYLYDLDSFGVSYFGVTCGDGLPDFWFAGASCAESEGLLLDSYLLLDEITPPADICVRPAQTLHGGFDLSILRIRDQGLTVSLLNADRPPDLHVTFVSGLPRLTDISKLIPGTQYSLRITATDGTTPAVQVERSFIYQGESIMVIGRGSPLAVMAPHGPTECDGPEGGQVVLDGSASEDGGFGDVLVRYDWYEDHGLPGERLLGSGVRLTTTLSVGAHEVTLVVTDAAGAAGTATSTFQVTDSVPPTLSLALNPSTLWPPNHRLVPVQVTWIVSDACDPSPSVFLESVVSSEPDDAPGGEDGATTGDIAGAEGGAPDAQVLLRAERSGSGDGRTYELAYAASDDAGNTSRASALAVVRHDPDRRESPPARPGAGAGARDASP